MFLIPITTLPSGTTIAPALEFIPGITCACSIKAEPTNGINIFLTPNPFYNDIYFQKKDSNKIYLKYKSK
jgi:hypothetical protein